MTFAMQIERCTAAGVEPQSQPPPYYTFSTIAETRTGTACEDTR
jgi:hypothetical protein